MKIRTKAQNFALTKELNENTNKSTKFWLKDWQDLVSYAYLLSGLCPHVRYAYFGQEFLSSKLANHSFTHENCGA
jgi:hypothetical protein